MKTYDEALSALQQLEEHDKLSPFLCGDIVHGLVTQGGEQVTKQLAGDLGRSLAWVRQRSAVAAAFPPDARTNLWGGEEPPPPVTWLHHRVVVYCAEFGEYGYWIERAIDEELSSRQLEELIRGEDPDTPLDIVVVYDPGAAEVHVQFREGEAAAVTDTGMPGVSFSVDTDGRVLSARLMLPEECVGRKIRVRRVR